MSDENETRGIQVHTGSRIGYAHPSLSRDEVERLDRLRAEAGDRASAELAERALFDGDTEALAALGFRAYGDPVMRLDVRPPPPVMRVGDVIARAERAEAQLAALREAARNWRDYAALSDALADTAAAADAYARRVRAEALREAAGTGRRAISAAWLRARADEIERGEG